MCECICICTMRTLMHYRDYTNKKEYVTEHHWLVVLFYIIVGHRHSMITKLISYKMCKMTTRRQQSSDIYCQLTDRRIHEESNSQSVHHVFNLHKKEQNIKHCHSLIAAASFLTCTVCDILQSVPVYISCLRLFVY